MPRSDSAEFTVERVFDAPRALVFRLWTDPKYVAQWWGIENCTIPVCELDVRPGGAWRIHMRTADGTIYPNRGVYVEVVENERLVSTDVPDPTSPAWAGAPPQESLQTTTFEDVDGKTRVTLRARFASEADRDRMLRSGVKAGIEQSLNRFERLLIQELRAHGA
jgi:uncharacterized protein YndB with AHSA1/START domain